MTSGDRSATRSRTEQRPVTRSSASYPTTMQAPIDGDERLTRQRPPRRTFHVARRARAASAGPGRFTNHQPMKRKGRERTLALQARSECLALHESLLAMAPARLLVAQSEAGGRGALRRMRGASGARHLDTPSIEGVIAVPGLLLAIGTDVDVRGGVGDTRSPLRRPTGFSSWEASPWSHDTLCPATAAAPAHLPQADLRWGTDVTVASR